MKNSIVTTIITALISAVVGGLIVLGAVVYYQPLKTQKRSDKPTRTIVTKVKNQKYTAEDIYNKLSPAVVNVSALSVGADFFGLRSGAQEKATGSGFVVSKDGLIITNEHVVEGADKVKVTLLNKRELTATVLGTDRSTDLAVLKINLPSGITPLKLADSSTIRVGDTVFAIGNPLGYERSMSQGIISALGRTIDSPNGFQINNVIQTDAAINRGSSGGPLIDTNGEVVGVTAQIVTEGGTGNIGIAFAIPSSTVKKIVNQIKSKGRVSHAWLGISGRDVTKALADKYDLPVSYGALVVDVFPNSPAGRAKLQGSGKKIGDIIVEFDKHQIKSMQDLVKTIDEYDVGKQVKLVFYRDGKKMQTTVTLGNRPQKNISIQ